MTAALATLWCGPVSLAQVAGATTGPVVAISCCGAADPKCPPIPCGQIADGFLDAEGRRVPSLIAARGLPPTTSLAAAGFSAGGMILKRLCLDARDRAQLRVLHSADADYEAARGASGGPLYTEGYVRYALDVLSLGDKLFVATASANPNKTFGSGIEVLAATRAEIERRSGRAFQVGGTLPGVDEAPSALYRLGNVWMAEYADVPHEQHATRLAAKVWRGLILPWLATPGAVSPGGAAPRPTTTEPPPKWPLVLALAAGAAAGYGAVRALRAQS